MLAKAKRRVLIASFNFHLNSGAYSHWDVTKQIKEALARGVSIDILVGHKKDDSTDYGNEVRRRFGDRVSVYTSDIGHSKLVLGDDDVKIVGSCNWFGGGDFYETSVYIRVLGFDGNIEKDWQSIIGKYKANSGKFSASDEMAVVDSLNFKSASIRLKPPSFPKKS